MGYGSSCCRLKILVMKVTLPRARRVPQGLCDLEHMWCTRQQWGVPSWGIHVCYAGSSAKKLVAGCCQEPSKDSILWKPLVCELRLPFHECFQKERGERILAFHCSTVTLDISEGNADFIWILIIHRFYFCLFVLICSQVFCSDLCRATCSSLTCNRDWQRWYSFPLFLAFSEPVLPGITQANTDKLISWRLWEYYHQF